MPQTLRRSVIAEPKHRDVQISVAGQGIMTLSPDEADRLAVELAASAALARAVRQIEGGS